MHRPSSPCLAVLMSLAALAAGCSNATEPEPEPGSWEPLAAGDWSLAAGTEDYVCVRATMSEDTYIGALRPIAPPGTHHTVLTVVDEPEPDGVFACDASMNGDNALYGSGVGTESFTLPEGVALKVAAGQQLLLNLHLFNATTGEIGGRSGVEIVRLSAADVVDEAEVVLAGKMQGLVVPQGESTQNGLCTLEKDVRIAAVLPHLHMLGTHLTGKLAGPDRDTMTLIDVPYDFDEQTWYPIDSEPAAAGDRFEIACSYDNTTGATVQFGESSESEMCFMGALMYPKTDRDTYYCVD